MVRNGWYLPPLKSRCISLKYLVCIQRGIVYCPQFKDVRLQPCVSRLPKKQIYQDIRKLVNEKGMKLGIKSEQMPVADWLANVLSTLNPNHKMFSKSFEAPKRERKRD